MESARGEILRSSLTWPLRPVMTSLNGDNSWLFSLPRPTSDKGHKYFFHIVFEPWLAGPAIKFGSWMVHISLSKKPEITDAEGIEAAAQQIEEAAETVAPKHGVSRTPIVTTDSGTNYKGLIDAILPIFFYTDHLHEATLRLFDPRIPIICSPQAKAIVAPWNHFQTMSLISDLSSSSKTWRNLDLHPDALPQWLTVVRLPGQHELNFIGAIIWTHDSEDGNEVHEALLESPHGTFLEEGPLQAFLDSEPGTKKLALMHGLKENSTGTWKNTLGAEGGLALHRKIGGAKYWLLSHHSTLSYSGIVMRLLSVCDTPRTLQWALDQEAAKGAVEGKEPPNVVEVDNGGCFVLA